MEVEIMAKRQHPRLRDRVLRTVMALREPVAIIALVLATRTVVAEPFYVPSGSMEPTLLIGDEFLASKFAYGYGRYSLPLDIGVGGRLLGKLPERGDVVAFRLPRDPTLAYVKRVIGLPGDRVQMRAGQLWINETRAALERDPYATAPTRWIETLPNGRAHSIIKLTWTGELDDTPVFLVPPDHLFMMGDNRDNSLDSRIDAVAGGVGYVPIDNLIGRADRLFVSWDRDAAQRSVWAWPAGLRLSRFLARVD
jgi:signal peptidase I